jgi:putative transposase
MIEKQARKTRAQVKGPQAAKVELSVSEKEALEAVMRRHKSSQQLVGRARILLLAHEGKNNEQIACELKISVDTVRLWRRRWLGFQGIALADLSVSERLEDAPRPGKPPTIMAEQLCQIVALACEPPHASERPISHWSGRELADEIKKRQIVEHISPRHARRLLKRGICSPTVFVTG